MIVNMWRDVSHKRSICKLFVDQACDLLVVKVCRETTVRCLSPKLPWTVRRRNRISYPFEAEFNLEYSCPINGVHVCKECWVLDLDAYPK